MLRKFKISIDGKEYLVEMEEIGAPQPVAQTAVPQAIPAAQPVVAEQPVSVPTPVPAASPSGNGEVISAPMPGNIIDVLVKVGDVVSVDQCLVILEAMKMENEIVAPIAGTVTEIFVTKGSAIDVGQPMITIE
jgi:Biotin carboxyl carrier protein